MSKKICGCQKVQEEGRMNIAQGSLLRALNGHLNRQGIPQRGDTCIHMTDSLYYTAETNTAL